MIDYDIQPWRKLNISVDNAERKDFNFQEFFDNSKCKGLPGGFFEWRGEEVYEIMNSSWLEYMKKINLEIDHIFGFYRKPYYQHPSAHVDMYHKEKQMAVFAINYVLDPLDDSEMVWYKFPKEQGDMIAHDTQSATQSYTSWPIEQLEGLELARHTVGREMTMVSIGTPHTISMGSRERWCLSFRIKYDVKNWNEAVQLMDPYIIC